MTRHHHAVVAVCLAFAAISARAETFDQAGPTRQGRLQFILVGASMVDNQGLANGVNCLWPSATTVVTAAALPPRARLVQAVLYLGGSLIDDSGLGADYTNPDLDIFVAPTTCGPSQNQLCRAETNPVEIAAVEEAARAAADESVELLPPGASAPITVGGPGARPYITAYYKGAGPEQGNVAFFVTPIDVTDTILDQGGGILEGEYTVSGLLPDICLGAEAICANPPNAPTCGTESATHTNGAGSFALLLMVEDPELPLHSIAVFQGLESLAGKSVNVTMQTANQISDPAAGSLAVYVLEGDLGISSAPNCTAPTDEYIEVDGDETPQQDGLCLFDDDNPLGNPFNATINVQPQSGSPPCGGGIEECCGDGLCPVTGVDIDRYNISPALVPGVNAVRATVATGGDRIALGLVVLGVDVFEPVLNEDTQVRVLDPGDASVMRRDDDGNILVRVGAPVIYSVAVSNTGNVSATSASVRFLPPAQTAITADDAVLLVPPDAGPPTVSVTGGDNGTGEILVSGFEVPAGEIAEVRVRVWTTCGAAERTLAPTVVAGSAEVAPFTVDSDCTSMRGNCFDVTVRGPSDEGSGCGADPDGPFGLLPDGRSLRGGGGCRGTPGVSMALLMLVGALAWRRRVGGALAAMLLLTNCTAERQPTGSGPNAPPPGVPSLEGLPGEACGGPLMVWVTRADSSRFCIDRFEATLDSGDLGDAHQGSDDLDLNTNGSTTAGAAVVLGEPPVQGISWYQAKAACENVGKRLCALEEWESACRGPAALIYPYGDRISDSACQGFFAYPEEKPSVTGSLASCLSPWGAYNLSGNVEEWTATAAERIPGSGMLNDRVVRGGSFKSNSNALACIGDEFHEAPGNADIDRGFRCCSDGVP